MDLHTGATFRPDRRPGGAGHLVPGPPHCRQQTGARAPALAATGRGGHARADPGSESLPHHRQPGQLLLPQLLGLSQPRCLGHSGTDGPHGPHLGYATRGLTQDKRP
eukprot:636616-Lingulodinium_polyedra.AAC.1